MSRKSREARRRCRPTWVVLVCGAIAACGDSESGANTGGMGPGPNMPDVRDAAGGAAGFDATDDARDERENPDASGMADNAAGDAGADVSLDKSVATDAPSERSIEDIGSSDGEGGGPVVSDVGACVATVVTPRRLTPALYLMIDNTTSMDTIDMQQAMSRWDALIAAMPIFVDDSANIGLSLGLDFFPEPSQDGGTALCAVSDYITPQVPIGLLGGPSTPQGTAITGAVRARARAGTSPTVPALSGALQHARDWANSQALPPRIDVVLLTDGLPVGCTLNNNTIAGAEAAARAAFMGVPSIKTHVLGVGAAAPAELHQIAVAGGTMQAVYVTESSGPAVAAGLQTVRANSHNCDVSVEGARDYSFVNFELRDAGGGVTRLGKADHAAACGTANGWYYDNPARPTAATLCPTPCAALEAGAAVAMLIGCRTIILPP